MGNVAYLRFPANLVTLYIVCTFYAQNCAKPYLVHRIEFISRSALFLTMNLSSML